jgi:hypothetical protein
MFRQAGRKTWQKSSVSQQQAKNFTKKREVID